MKSRIALSNMAIALMVGLLASHQDYIGRGWLITLSKYAAIAAGATAVVAQHEKHRLQMADYIQGLRDVTDDMAELWVSSGAQEWVAETAQRVTVVPFDTMPSMRPEPTYEPLERLGIGSYAIYAGKGKGKSQLFVWLCRQFAKAGAEVKIGDTHALKTAVDYGEYFPGLDRGKYLTTEYLEILELYRYAERVLDQRRRDWDNPEKQREGRPLVIAVEEFNTVASQLNDEQFQELTKIIERIENEARWYKVFNLITTKSLKLKNTGIDSTIMSQLDWLVLQGGFDDPNTKFLEGFDRKAVSNRQKELGGFAVAHYQAGSSTVNVFKLPDNAEFGATLKRQSETLFFEEGDAGALYIEKHRSLIHGLLRNTPTLSASKLAEKLPEFGKRSDSNPKWVALKKSLDELRETANQEPDNPFKIEDLEAA